MLTPDDEKTLYAVRAAAKSIYHKSLYHMYDFVQAVGQRAGIHLQKASRRLLTAASDTALLPYRVGALLYVPALRQGIASQLAEGRFPGLQAVCLCLEDAVQDAAVQDAESQLKATLKEISGAPPEAGKNLPLLFVRVRTPQHLARVRAQLAELEMLIAGYVLPKLDSANAEEYMRVLDRNRRANLYVMPILESGCVAAANGRARRLEDLRAVLDAWHDRILNFRVGGNDLCGLFGVRRSIRQTIYDIGVVRDIMSDIVGVFGRDYVVSAPVWEYFGQDADGAWAQGLRRELELDLVNGFVGKTAIHPSQVPVIHDAMKVAPEDLEDALRILGWAENSFGVEKSAHGTRMNEVKTHVRWARRTYALARVFGTRDAEPGSPVQGANIHA